MIAEKLLADQNFSRKDDLFFHNQFINSDFEDAYIDVREKEGRILTEEEVRTLPELDRNHPHFHEWNIRNRSTSRIVKYLSKKNSSKNILEIGCGNGWLSNRLSQINNVQVIGLDINVTELKQAASVFKSMKNLAFIVADIFSIHLPVQADYIVLGSSIQYFSDLNRLLDSLLPKLSTDGEIHILDTPFYDSDEANHARKRSEHYFRSHNSKMIDHYHHHTWEDLSRFNFEILYHPSTLLTRLKNKVVADSPFPWIKIRNGSNER